MSALWSLEGVSAALAGRPVLTEVSLTVAPGEVVGVLGPNGAGKTSLIRAGLGLLAATGQVWLGDRELAGLSAPERARRVGYLPQERRLGWNLAVGRLVELGAPDLPAGEAHAVARASLERVGMGELGERGVLDLSGGERARVLLARLLATRAPLLVADEPAAGLDPDSQLLALELLRNEAERGVGVLVTLHDLGLAARACDRLVVLDGGRVAADGAPREALSPQVLSRVFRLEGDWIEGPHGPLLSARRLGGRTAG